MKALIITLSLTFLFAVVQNKPYFERNESVELMDPIDDMLHNKLEGLRPNLTNLNIANLNTSLNVSGIFAFINFDNITLLNLEKFVIVNSDTGIIPPALKNLTLFLDEVTIDVSQYFLNGTVDLEVLQDVVKLSGEGPASVTLRGVNLDLGATINITGLTFQLKEITHLTLTLEEAAVNFSNLMNNPDLTKLLNVFLGFFLVEFWKDQGPALLLIIGPILIDIINSALAG